MSILAISTLVTGASEEALICVSCIYHLVWFQKDEGSIQALINFSSKVNAILLVYTKKLELQIRKIDIDVQKTDGLTLSTIEMVIVGF